MKVPEGKTIMLTFGSHPNKDPLLRWTAWLTFPGGAGADALLPLEVVDGNGDKVASGFFEIAGRKVKIVSGRGALPYAEFIAGRHETGLWLHVAGRESVPGGLTFA